MLDWIDRSDLPQFFQVVFKGAKITEPPRIYTATPTTANQRTTPAHWLTEFPDCQRAALALKRQGLTGRAMTGDAGEIG